MGLTFILPTLIVTATGFSLTLLMAAALSPRHPHEAGVRLDDHAADRRRRLGAVLGARGVGARDFLRARLAAARHRVPRRDPARLRGGSARGPGCYYGINYYLLLAAQSERMLKVAAQANSAQLEMLRYQLNPHFLFNTLNSISTLVPAQGHRARQCDAVAAQLVPALQPRRRARGHGDRRAGGRGAENSTSTSSGHVSRNGCARVSRSRLPRWTRGCRRCSFSRSSRTPSNTP